MVHVLMAQNKRRYGVAFKSAKNTTDHAACAVFGVECVEKLPCSSVSLQMRQEFASSQGHFLLPIGDRHFSQELFLSKRENNTDHFS